VQLRDIIVRATDLCLACVDDSVSGAYTDRKVKLPICLLPDLRCCGWRETP